MAFSRRDSRDRYHGGVPADFGPRANAFRPLTETSYDISASTAAQLEARDRMLAHQQQIEDTKARYFFYGVTTAYAVVAVVGALALWLRMHP